ncbi:Splicing factor, arginine/serine-rich 18 [Cyphomyrmex costatus]|uniref:Splicing factor, arginine/serine-rich 18 n=1 Tax=Cyphomyrmex costatus TaxID=456900 RepID=A0A151IN06_9HYME|nr:Splicing factor, arginine/serine-rich 18 [Cyphomyrmex costatus]
MKMSGDMFEGKDYPTQWALNPSAYQNMSNDQVDWAALAQQWIKMKETVVPPAPPPPSINPICSITEGSGEAPMDMDTKDDDVPPAPPAPTISGSEAWTQWNQWGHWNASTSGTGNWEWSGVPPPGVTVDPDGKPIGLPAVSVIPPAPTISSTTTDFNTPPPAPSLYSYNSVPPGQPYNQVSNYWSGDPPNAISPQPLPFMKGMRHANRGPHMRAMDSIRGRDDREKTPEEDTTTTIDAAKRRQLPAWIREGLEKMEKEKQKAMEKERLEILRKQELEARKQAEDEARAVLNPSKSKFDSDSEKETEQDFDASNARGQQSVEKTYDRTPDIIVRPRKSRFRDADSPESHTGPDESPTAVVSTVPITQKRSREEILQDVMLKVRRSLTEILLEVTNEEIGAICREVWSRARAKGLSIYNDSNSESEEEQNEHTQIQNDDSDEELKETLRRRQQAFRKTEEEIEARLAEEEEEEEQQRSEEQYSNKQQENHTGNTSCRESVDEKETVDNQREASETLSSSSQSPTAAVPQNAPAADGQQVAKPNNSTVSGSADSESSSTESTSSLSESSRESAPKKHYKKARKQQSQQREQQHQRYNRRRKSKSRSKSRSGRRSIRSSRSSERGGGGGGGGDGNHAHIPEKGDEVVDRAASRAERNAEDRARERAVVHGIIDGQGPTFLGGVNGGVVDPDRETEVESHGPSRAIVMVRSRHIDTGIEVRIHS